MTMIQDKDPSDLTDIALTKLYTPSLNKINKDKSKLFFQSLEIQGIPATGSFIMSTPLKPIRKNIGEDRKKQYIVMDESLDDAYDTIWKEEHLIIMERDDVKNYMASLFNTSHSYGDLETMIPQFMHILIPGLPRRFYNSPRFLDEQIIVNFHRDNEDIELRIKDRMLFNIVLGG